jgi:succinate dehydrogenase/fumarate reductase flavoprotein subunit
VSLIPQLDDIFFFRPDERYPLKFTRTALGKNSLDSFVSKMMKRAGYKGYYTNHSIKATMAAKMYKQGYQEEFIPMTHIFQLYYNMCGDLYHIYTV